MYMSQYQKLFFEVHDLIDCVYRSVFSEVWIFNNSTLVFDTISGRHLEVVQLFTLLKVDQLFATALISVDFIDVDQISLSRPTEPSARVSVLLFPPSSVHLPAITQIISELHLQEVLKLAYHHLL